MVQQLGKNLNQYTDNNDYKLEGLENQDLSIGILDKEYYRWLEILSIKYEKWLDSNLTGVF